MTVLERSKLITPEMLLGLYKVFDELLGIYRWSTYIADDRYNESGKQALNIMLAYILASEAKHNGEKIDMTRLPKIILYRTCEKLVLCDMRESYIYEILESANIGRELFNQVVEKRIESAVGARFAEFIDIDRECYEARIFQCATKIATQIEFVENGYRIHEEEYKTELESIEETLLEFEDIPGVDRILSENSKEMKLFRDISALRNRLRWAKRIRSVNCYVLGHSFEVAVLGYLNALRETGDEEIATKCFFIGAFHDLPETFTGDMPQPVKDSIPGLRIATEKFERKMVEKHIYNNLAEHLKNAIKFLLEEKDYEWIIKRADYWSADLECMRNIEGGSREPYFRQVLERDLNVDGYFNPFYVSLKRMYGEIAS